MVDRSSLTDEVEEAKARLADAAPVFIGGGEITMDRQIAIAMGRAVETLLTALEAAQARAEKAEASLVEAMGALKGWAVCVDPDDPRPDDTWVNLKAQLGDFRRASDVHSRLLEGVSGEGGSARADLSRASSSPTPSPAGEGRRPPYVFHSLSSCAGCGASGDYFPSPDAEAYEVTGELYCDECAEEAIALSQGEQ